MVCLLSFFKQYSNKKEIVHMVTFCDSVVALVLLTGCVGTKFVPVESFLAKHCKSAS